jgi:CheY-like chemotaxis protein/HPt (histidine-containing phosphotransfer) domain-containing protein
MKTTITTGTAGRMDKVRAMAARLFRQGGAAAMACLLGAAATLVAFLMLRGSAPILLQDAWLAPACLVFAAFVGLHTYWLKSTQQQATELARRSMSRLAAEHERLGKERANLDAIFNFSPIAMLVLNERTEIIRANRVAQAMAGKDASANAINQTVTLALLKKLGYRADAVANGEEAIKAIQDLPYDLVLMDCQMPEMDGYEATRRIRRGEPAVRNPAIPIIAMTAHAMKGDREVCLAAGMSDYLSKPVRPDELARVLAQWTAASPADFDAEIEDAAETGKDPLPTSPEELKAILDHDSLIHRVMGDEDLGRAVIAGFLEDMPKQIDLLKQRLGAGDSPAVCRQAHTIKGAAATVGAGLLCDVAFQMEQAGKAGQIDRAADMLPHLEEEFDRVKSTLERLGWTHA